MSFLAKAGKTVRQNRNIVLAYVAMLVLLTAVSIYRPGFGWGDPRHLRALVLQAAVIGLASMGQTVVIISGGADLSVPWTLTGAAIIMTMMTQGQNAAMLWAIPIVLFGCMIVGLINGIGVTVLGVAPMIMTLAMNYILLGLIAGIGMGGVATMGQYGQPPELILTAGTGTVGEIPYLIIIWLVLAVMLTVLLGRTGFGRRVLCRGHEPVRFRILGDKGPPHLDSGVRAVGRAKWRGWDLAGRQVRAGLSRHGRPIPICLFFGSHHRWGVDLWRERQLHRHDRRLAAAGRSAVTAASAQHAPAVPTDYLWVGRVAGCVVLNDEIPLVQVPSASRS